MLPARRPLVSGSGDAAGRAAVAAGLPGAAAALGSGRLRGPGAAAAAAAVSPLALITQVKMAC